jgi:hypothetical protein
MVNNNISGTIGLVNISVNSNFNSPILTPSSYFIRTINGIRRNVIYYDPDIFDNLIILSASLLIGSDEKPWREHYNTVHDENVGTSGTAWQTLEEIAIPIYPRPKRTKIEGVKRMDVNTTHPYNVPSTYDTTNLYTYDWYIEGSAIFTQNSSTTLLNAGKIVNIHFTVTDTVVLKLKITNPAGCFRWVIRTLYPGTLTKKLLIVRYPYF